MSKYQTYLSLHEANDAVNASRPLIARLYQMNTLLKKHLKKCRLTSTLSYQWMTFIRDDP